jgi:flagellin-like protein
MKIIKSKKAVSDVIATIILLAIAITLFSVVHIIVYAYPFNPTIPSVNMVGSINDGVINIKHNYGDPLDLETKIILRIGSNNHNLTAKIDTTLDTSGDGYWSIGESFMINSTEILSDPTAGKYVGVTVVDIKSNSVVMMADLQIGTT